MRSRLVRGGGGASGLLVIDGETGKTVCARAPGRQRPLASNMKLFTTATALGRLGAESTDPDPAEDRRWHRSQRRPARQPLPGRGRRPHPGHPLLLQALPRRPRHQHLPAQAPGSRSRDQVGNRPPLRRRQRLRPAARRRRLRLRDELRNRAALRPLLQLRLQHGVRLSFATDPALTAAATLNLALRQAGVSISPSVALGTHTVQHRARPGRIAAADQHRQHHRRLLVQLLRRDVDQAGRRPLRQRRNHSGGRQGRRGLRPQPRIRRARRRRLRPDSLQPCLAGPSSRTAQIDAETPTRATNSSRTSP